MRNTALTFAPRPAKRTLPHSPCNHSSARYASSAFRFRVSNHSVDNCPCVRLCFSLHRSVFDVVWSACLPLSVFACFCQSCADGFQPMFFLVTAHVQPGLLVRARFLFLLSSLRHVRYPSTDVLSQTLQLTVCSAKINHSIGTTQYLHPTTHTPPHTHTHTDTHTRTHAVLSHFTKPDKRHPQQGLPRRLSQTRFLGSGVAR